MEPDMLYTICLIAIAAAYGMLYTLNRVFSTPTRYFRWNMLLVLAPVLLCSYVFTWNITKKTASFVGDAYKGVNELPWENTANKIKRLIF